MGITDPSRVERCVDRKIQEVGNTPTTSGDRRTCSTFAAKLKTEVALDVEVDANVSFPEQGEGILIMRKGEAGKDRRLAEASFRDARESYRQRYVNHSSM